MPTMENSQRLQYLFHRYLNNTCTRSEMDELLAFIKNAHDDDNLQVNDILDKWYDNERTTLKGDYKLLDWSTAKNKILPQSISSGQNFPWYRLAAAVLLTVLASYFLFNLKTNISNDRAGKPPIASLQTRQEHRLITLPDGSTVLLNGESKIDFPVVFNTSREVTLTGEAFFDIKHDSTKPFIIHAAGTKTTVLGTAFNIRAFPKETSVTVTVKRGKVQVENTHAEREVITANQQLSVNLYTDEVVQQQVETKDVAEWTKEEDLILDNIYLEDAVKIIEDQFDVTVQFDNSKMKLCRFTSTFLKHATLDQMLTAVSMVNNATFTLHKNTVTLYGQGCSK